MRVCLFRHGSVCADPDSNRENSGLKPDMFAYFITDALNAGEDSNPYLKIRSFVFYSVELPALITFLLFLKLLELCGLLAARVKH